MITIYGPENTPDYEAARQLRNLITAEWPEVEQDHRHNVSIVTSAKCYGQQVVEIDLVLFVRLAKPLPTHILFKERISDSEEIEHNVHVQYLCITFECKLHSVNNVIFEGNQVKVRYPNRLHNASEQSFQQQISLRNYLSENNLRSPYVFNLIWLRSIVEKDLPQMQHNIIGRNSTWRDILQRVYELKGKDCRWNDVAKVYEMFVGRNLAPSYLAKACDALTAQIEKSPLDRTRIEVITRRVIKEQKYGEQLGKQLLIFRGRGGTGKTVRLLRLAYQMYEEQDSKILLLTYNRALVADIKRLLGLMGVNQAFSERSITIKTIHSFMGKVMHYFGICVTHDSDFHKNYPTYTQEIVSLIDNKVLTKDDIKQAIHQQPEAFDWDYILVDEAQDWPTDERDILFFMYDYQKFVLADGVDQFVRNYGRVDWRQKVPRDNSQIVTLKQSLRLKDGLCRFLHAFAREMGLDDWDIETNPEVYGGRVIIIEGHYASSSEVHDGIVQQHAEHGNEPIDMLLCVPPLLAQKSKTRDQSIVAAKLQSWGLKVWDGTVEQVRETPPSTMKQFRIIQYESCRGLEGWSVINLGFDEFYDNKFQNYDSSDIEQHELYTDAEKLAHLFATRWLMIPLTRGIDTLVIQVSSSDHVVTKALRNAAKKCEDVVEWKVTANKETTK